VEAWTATKQENGHWLFAWDADSGESFEIWWNGTLLNTVVGGEFDCELNGYAETPPPLEVVADESGVDAESELYPPFVILQWRGVSGATAYLVEQYVSGAWIARKTVMERERGYYTYQTAVLEDDTETTFRVSALDARGTAGTPVNFSFKVVRNPAPPDVSFSMESGASLVVEEA